MKPFTVSAFYLVDRANTIVQRALEHGLRMHFSRVSDLRFHMKIQTDVRSLSESLVQRVGQLRLASYVHLLDICAGMLCSAVIVLSVECMAKKVCLVMFKRK